MTSKDSATAIDKHAGNPFTAAPSVMTPYSQLVKAASGIGALDRKIKELMAFSVAIEMGGGPPGVYDGRALNAFEELSQ